MSVKKDVTVQMFDKILQWQQSGRTQKAYCEQENIALTSTTFTYRIMHLFICKLPVWFVFKNSNYHRNTKSMKTLIVTDIINLMKCTANIPCYSVF
jgi:hypothetical protein